MTGDHSNEGRMGLVKIGRHIEFGVHRRSYSLRSPVIGMFCLVFDDSLTAQGAST